MSNTSKGKRAEQRVQSIMAGLGYTLVAKARNVGFYRGGTWQPGGAIDLLEGAVDLVHSKDSGRVVFSSVTHVGSESPRRQKMRAAQFDPAHGWGMVWAWSADERHFRLYRAEGDYLDEGWRISEGAEGWPWDMPTQAVL
jgi:hypothetical protein